MPCVYVRIHMSSRCITTFRGKQPVFSSLDCAPWARVQKVYKDLPENCSCRNLRERQEQFGCPLAHSLAPPHETKLVVASLQQRFTAEVPQLLIGDKAYDSDPLDEKLKRVHGTELVEPHKENRSKPPTQDGRRLRRMHDVGRWSGSLLGCKTSAVW